MFRHDRADNGVKQCWHDGLVCIEVGMVLKPMQPPVQKFGRKLKLEVVHSVVPIL